MSFTRETIVKAVRKRHVCDGCGEHIEVGQPAIKWAGITDGDFGTAIYHADCREAEVAMNRKNGWYGDEWYGLRDIEHKDLAWLADEHPAVFQRMGFAGLQPQEDRS